MKSSKPKAPGKRAKKSKPAKSPNGGAEIRALRRAAGLTQSEASAAIGGKNTPQLFFKIETGNRMFSAQERADFFARLGKPVDMTIPALDEEGLEKRNLAITNFKLIKLKSQAKAKAVDATGAPTQAAPAAKPAKAPKAKGEAKAVTPSTVATATLAPLAPVTPLLPQAQGPSAVKAAAVAQITQVITNPSVTNSQAAELLNLFNALTVTVLMKAQNQSA